MVVSIISIIWFGFNLGLDFQGGMQMDVKSSQTIPFAQLRATVDSLHFGQAQVSSFAGTGCDHPVNSCATIRVELQDAKSQDASNMDQAVATAVMAKLGPTYTLRDQARIGAKVSNELLTDGVEATVFAILLISVWVWFRFEWQYGVGALIATGHDVLVTAGFYSVFHFEFDLNTVAALLLLAGYSINDTVVVFDRIRENRRKYKRMPLPDLINLSTNHIATRTTLVSMATALSVIPLLFGGPVLLNFSRAILFGIAVGTFSSTYVASMLLLYLPAVGGGGGKAEKPADATA